MILREIITPGPVLERIPALFTTLTVGLIGKKFIRFAFGTSPATLLVLKHSFSLGNKRSPYLDELLPVANLTIKRAPWDGESLIVRPPWLQLFLINGQVILRPVSNFHIVFPLRSRFSIRPSHFCFWSVRKDSITSWTVSFWRELESIPHHIWKTLSLEKRKALLSKFTLSRYFW